MCCNRVMGMLVGRSFPLWAPATRDDTVGTFLTPRPHPAFCHLLYGKAFFCTASDEKNWVGLVNLGPNYIIISSGRTQLGILVKC